MKKRPAKKAPKRPATPPAALNPSAVSVADLGRLLGRFDPRVDSARIEADLEAGAPANPDGTLHLVHYTAWLAGQVK